MEIILLGIYSLFVWLIFIKFKWLPWTTPWKVAVAIFPVVAIAALHTRLARLEASGVPSDELKAVRADIEALESKLARHGAS